MQPMYYIGLDVHKRTISYCVKDGSGMIHAEGTLPAAAVDRGDGSHGFYRVDLRSLAAPRRRGEGSASVDAASHRGGEKEERSH
jgi:hypothetical protein